MAAISYFLSEPLALLLMMDCEYPDERITILRHRRVKPASILFDDLILLSVDRIKIIRWSKGRVYVSVEITILFQMIVILLHDKQDYY